MKKHKEGRGKRKLEKKLLNQRITVARRKSIPTRGERHVISVLKKCGIKYYREFTEPKLRNPETGCNLFFDFFLPDFKAVVEFDGPHHYEPVYGEREFIAQQKKDRIKDHYCSAKGYYMIRLRGTNHHDYNERMLKRLLRGLGWEPADK